MTSDSPHVPASLPRILTPLPQGQVMERMQTASKRGRMAGFSPGQGGLFSVAAHAQPFDGVLIARLSNGELCFELRMSRKIPVIFAVVLALTIWPGVYLMDQLIPGEWGWIPTWWWYLPITVIPIPWIWRGLLRRSRHTMHASAIEAINKIAREVDGRIEPQPTPR